MVKRFIWGFIGILLLGSVVYSFVGFEVVNAQVGVTCPTNQSTPHFTQGGTFIGRLASQWNTYFSSKVDANNGTLCNPTFGSGAVFNNPVIVGNANFNNTGSPVNLNSPINPNDAATKSYVDGKETGLVPQIAVQWETGG